MIVKKKQTSLPNVLNRISRLLISLLRHILFSSSFYGVLHAMRFKNIFLSDSCHFHYRCDSDDLICCLCDGASSPFFLGCSTCGRFFRHYGDLCRVSNSRFVYAHDFLVDESFLTDNYDFRCCQRPSQVHSDLLAFVRWTPVESGNRMLPLDPLNWTVPALVLDPLMTLISDSSMASCDYHLRHASWHCQTDCLFDIGVGYLIGIPFDHANGWHHCRCFYLRFGCSAANPYWTIWFQRKFPLRTGQTLDTCMLQIHIDDFCHYPLVLTLSPPDQPECIWNNFS